MRILLVSDLHYRLRQFVLNAGQQLGPVPAHVEVDLDAGVAVWNSAEDRAEVSLR